MEKPESMTEPVARPTIPENWGTRASCPVCNHSGLRVRHTAESADQLSCNHCGSSFEVERDGSHIRLIETPPGLKPFIGGRWITMDEVHLAVRQKMKSAQPQSPVNLPPPPGAPPNLATLTATAKQLHRLGNTTKDVQKTLKNTASLAPKQVEEVMKEIDILEQQRIAKQRRTLLVYAFIVIMILIVLALVVLVANTLFKEILASSNLPQIVVLIPSLV